MLKDLNTQICANCQKENSIVLSKVQRSKKDLSILILPVCECGSREYLCVLSRTDNPGEHAELVRELNTTITEKGSGAKARKE